MNLTQVKRDIARIEGELKELRNAVEKLEGTTRAPAFKAGRPRRKPVEFGDGMREALVKLFKKGHNSEEAARIAGCTTMQAAGVKAGLSRNK